MCVNSENCQCGNTTCPCIKKVESREQQPGLFCRSGCKTKDHYSYRECAMGIGISAGETSKGRY